MDVQSEEKKATFIGFQSHVDVYPPQTQMVSLLCAPPNLMELPFSVTWTSTKKWFQRFHTKTWLGLGRSDQGDSQFYSLGRPLCTAPGVLLWRAVCLQPIWNAKKRNQHQWDFAMSLIQSCENARLNSKSDFFKALPHSDSGFVTFVAAVIDGEAFGADWSQVLAISRLLENLLTLLPQECCHSENSKLFSALRKPLVN